MQSTDYAIKRQLEHYDNLIRNSEILDDEESVRRYRYERAAYVAEMKEEG